MEEQIRNILEEHGRLSVSISSLTADVDLYLVGLTSHATVNVMLALEDHFEVEFPEDMLKKQTFESIASIQGAIEKLTAEPV